MFLRFCQLVIAITANDVNFPYSTEEKNFVGKNSGEIITVSGEKIGGNESKKYRCYPESSDNEMGEGYQKEAPRNLEGELNFVKSVQEELINELYLCGNECSQRYDHRSGKLKIIVDKMIKKEFYDDAAADEAAMAAYYLERKKRQGNDSEVK